MGYAEWCVMTREFLQGFKGHSQRVINHAQVEWDVQNGEA